MTTDPTIDYEGLAQEAMRGVVRNVLARVAKNGLPGEHHFYISFETEAPGVSLSKRLKEKYPREMTIVLQHRFWDLSVSEDRFEVKLTFDGIPERLVIPFQAVKVFFDPSVRFGLQFDDGTGAAGPQGFEAPTPSEGGAEGRSQGVGARKIQRQSRKPRAVETQSEGGTGSAAPRSTEAGGKPQALPARAPVKDIAAAKPSGQDAPVENVSSAEDASETEVAAKSQGAEIVSLDKFRKK